MTTNKTPIQELKEYLFNTFEVPAAPLWLKQTITFLETLEQKEKAFAFDCFEAGIGCLVKNTHSITIVDQIDLKKEFESFYVTQHNK